MQEYDVIVVGAGPAGGQCARDLSKAGQKVLLVEKVKDFRVNNFSSAGAPLEILEAFELPTSLVASFWRRLMIFTSHDTHVWQAPQPRGVVLDFMKLRLFLAEETVNNGGDVLLGWAYQGQQHRDGKTVVWLKRRGSRKKHAFLTKVLVDATGSERRVLLNGRVDRTRALVGTGVEYLVEVEPAIYHIYADALSFFIGLKWMPQGYAWIFPMQPNQLKVGVGRNFTHEHVVPHHTSFRFYLEQLMTERLHTKDWPILDTHGKTLCYTYHQTDLHFDHHVMAIGDAISMVNPLTFEGIRHAMMSGRMAAKHILKFLNGHTSSFKGYTSDIRRYCGIKWRISEILMKKIYREPEDEKIHRMLMALKGFTFEEMIDLTCYYKFTTALKFYVGYVFFNARCSLRRFTHRGNHE